MGLQKPQASKAPAYVFQPVTTLASQDPCCIPGGVAAGAIEANLGGRDSTSGGDHIGHIMEPTRH